MSPITLIIRPHCSPRTGKRVQGQFEARLDGKLICISHQPLLDGARVLAADGVDPATPIAVKHEGTAFDALRSTVGAAAKLTVEESGPRFAPWKPFPRSAVGAPMRFSGSAVPDTGCLRATGKQRTRNRKGAQTAAASCAGISNG